MLKFKKSEIHKLANQLTCNSELFGDEFGCTMEGKIFDCWGSSVSVIALPDKAKHSWEF